jgi:hypothetical protein
MLLRAKYKRNKAAAGTILPLFCKKLVPHLRPGSRELMPIHHELRLIQ